MGGARPTLCVATCIISLYIYDAANFNEQPSGPRRHHPPLNTAVSARARARVTRENFLANLQRGELRPREALDYRGRGM